MPVDKEPNKCDASILKKRKKFRHQGVNSGWHFKILCSLCRAFFLGLTIHAKNHTVSCWPWNIPECFDLVYTWNRQSSQSVSQCDTVHSVKIQFFCQHRDHAGDLLLLTEAWVFRPGLEASSHHVVDPCKDLHYFQLFAKFVEDIAECLDKPRPTPRVPPGVVP